MPKVPTKLKVAAADLKQLRASGLTDATIKKNGIYTAHSPSEVNKLLARKDSKGGALVFPYHDLDGQRDGFSRVRPHKPRQSKGKDIKYEHPTGATPLRAYFPVDSIPQLNDGKSPIYITEGEKKALALSQLGIAAIGICGIYGWKPKDKEVLIPTLKAIEWKGRDVFIVFDYDEKLETQAACDYARQRLTKLLQDAGAREVYHVDLEAGPNGEKQGVDDFLVANGEEAFFELADPANMVMAGSMVDVERVVGETEFLVDGWVPLGLLTLVIAEPKVGKSAFCLCGLVQPLVMGNATWFDKTAGPRCPENALWIDTEQVASMNITRLNEWGVNKQRILVPFDKDPLRRMDLTCDDDLQLLRRLIVKYRLRLVVIDSLRGSHDGDENDSRLAKNMRRLAEIAEKTKAAIVIIHHTKKIPKGEEITSNSSRGSNAIIAAARSIIGLEWPDRSNNWRRVRLLDKNFKSDAEDIGFNLPKDGCPEFSTSHVPSPPPPPEKAVQHNAAKQFLLDFMERGKWYESAVVDKAAAQAGHVKATLDRAKTALGVKKQKLQKNWQCILP